MLPPAPPTFSITIGCPSEARMRSAMMRAAASVDPPGGNGTTRVIGRDGKFCAPALPIPARIASASIATNLIAVSSQCRPGAFRPLGQKYPADPVPMASERGSILCFDAFSLREPVPTSLENALVNFRRPLQRFLQLLQREILA